MVEGIKTICVIGAGTMGNGIAHVFAQNGYAVNLMDVNQDALDKAIAVITKNLDRLLSKERIDEATKEACLKNITSFTDLGEAVKNVELVVEAATENISLKERIFKDLDEKTGPNTILATNTSSISITRMAALTSKPDKVIGMHFMNPVPIMKLVEIINGYATDNAVTELITSLTKDIGKVPCVANDYPGFVANRILMPMINEAIICLQEGVAGVEDIDTIMKLGMAHPMGPLQLADFIGLDTCHSILKVMQDGFGKEKYAPATLLTNMVVAGKLGRKSGEGFYAYTKGSKDVVVSGQFL